MKKLKKLSKPSNMDTDFIFFGTPEFSVEILEILYQNNIIPKVIVTAPDRKVGRKQILTPPPVAVWAKEHHIELLQPEHPRDIVEVLEKNPSDFYVVAAYGYILSKKILALPKRGTLNVHTSLLPRWRGACPIESAILAGDTETGSTIMLMDEKLDHGAILAQTSFTLDPHINREKLFNILAHDGGVLLAKTIPEWIQDTLTPQEQNHDEASFCHKIEKEDGNITSDDDYLRYRKYLAYYGWPGVFIINEQAKRIKITEAEYIDETFIIKKVIPEGKNEMSYEQYLGSEKK